MANDVELRVGYESLKQANSEILQIGSSAQKSASVFERAFSRVESEQRKFERITQSVRKANQDYYSSLLNIATGSKSAKDSASIFTEVLKNQETQAKKTAIAINQITGITGSQATSGGAGFGAIEAEIDKLALKYNDVYRASKLYEASLSELTRAEQLGVISTRKFDTEVELLNKEFEQFQNGTNNLGNRFVRFDAGMQASGKSARRMQLGIQQAGYQVGDFAVQVASGTNWVTALTQQGTQLVSFFGGPWGAAIGAAGAIVGAFAVYLMKSGEAAGLAKKDFKELTDTFEKTRLSLRESLFSSQKGITDEELAKIAFQRQLLIEQRNELLKNGAAQREILGLNDQISLLSVEYARTLKVVTELHDEEKSKLKEKLELEAKREEAMNGFIQLQDQMNTYSEDEKEKLRKAHEYSMKLTEEIGLAGVRALRLAGVDIASGISDAAKEAAKLAGNLGLSLDAAISLKNRQSAKTPTLGAPIQGGRGAGYEYFPMSDYTHAAGYKSVDDLIKEYNDKANKKSGGGGKTPAEQLADNLKKLQEQIALQEELNGKTDAQRQIIQALGSDWSKVDAATLKGLEDKINAQDALNKKIEEQQNIANTLQSSMENSFMSIIDGTSSVKDAFKSLASDILKELYRVLVVQRMVGTWNQASGTGSGIVGAIMGAFQANGGVWQGGHQVQAFANGGVVGGPTMFPMAGGKTGLMGEAGPEAIMPLKRGKDGKLGVATSGDSGAVNIVQNFSFAANGDESVKKIIAQAAPQIAKMTQQQIIDSRRRGGAMKATFG